MTASHAQEIADGARFQFGANWQRFLASVDAERIQEAEHSLIEMLGMSRLDNLRFLDIGCGSGLFSLAARRLGAEVHSFDFDPDSVECTRQMRSRFGGNGESWTIEEGSVLDADYVAELGMFDIVYSWGVLHHTGDMWSALNQASRPVGTGGLLFIAIYNDQGLWSQAWRAVKQTYCSGPLGRAAVLGVFVPIFAIQAVARGVAQYRHPFGHFRQFKRKRGMSIIRDWIDWLGGLPFEYASLDAITEFYGSRGFTAQRAVTTRRWGCNQIVLRRADAE